MGKMEDHHRNLLSYCSEINFGTVEISPAEIVLRRRLSDAIVALCASLPPSMHTDAILFFVRHFHAPMAPAFNLFKNYYAPSWSIVHWLTASGCGSGRLGPEVLPNAITAHAMALMLHPLDDHLNDGQIPASHLALLVRSQSWMIMRTAMDHLANGCKQEESVISRFFDNYYSAISDPGNADALDSYCDVFRKQMATWLIVPVLMAKKMNAGRQFTADLQRAYGSFGVAWRLLDDIKDVLDDRFRGAHSAVYACLPQEKKDLWNHLPDHNKDDSCQATASILDCILENRIIDRLKSRIRDELLSSAAIAEGCNMGGLATELTALSRPMGQGKKWDPMDNHPVAGRFRKGYHDDLVKNL